MQEPKTKVLLTDGEGPLVFNDLAKSVSARHLPYGTTLFDALSLYNAFIAETRGPNLPGETLALLVPHLLTHQVTDEDLREEARNTTFAKGVESYLRALTERGWHIRVISTAYSHLWQEIGPKLSIPQHHISATELALANLEGRWKINSNLSKAVLEAEAFITLHQDQIRSVIESFRVGASLFDIFTEIEVMKNLGARLDTLYCRTLPDEGYNSLQVVEVIGGHRKVQRAISFIQDLGVEPSEVVYIGDSITDDRALKFFKESGGLAIAENGDAFAIRNAIIAIASEDSSHKVELLESWADNRWEGLRSFIKEQPILSKEREASLAVRFLKVFAIHDGEDYTEIAHQLRESRLRSQGAGASII